MIVGERLRELRENKNLSQGDIQKRTGLMRCYISRVENGHTVPAVETLEKLARALEVPMYRLFYEGDHPAGLPFRLESDTVPGGARYARRFARLLGDVGERDRKLLMHVARRMARDHRGRRLASGRLAARAGKSMGRPKSRRTRRGKRAA